MPLPSVYSDGTVTLVAGSTAVVGQGTAFALAVQAGDILWTPSGEVRLASIESNTAATLAWNWNGNSQSEGAYEIRITPDVSRAQETSRRVLAMLLQGSYAQPDATGTLAERDAWDDAAQGFIYWRTDIEPFIVYVKASAASGDWSDGTTIQGPAGAQGVPGEDGNSFEVDAIGPFEDRALFDDEEDGFSFLSTTAGEDAVVNPAGSLYIREGVTGGVWSDPVPFGKGEQGDAGWGPVFSVVADGVRRVLRLVAYVGGGGDAPTADLNKYVGASGLVTSIGDAVDIRGATGATGSMGWSPTHSVVADGDRRVLRLVGYVGGEGTAPTANVGQYVGPTGYVALIASATDIRGTTGAKGDTGDQGEQGEQGEPGDTGWSPVYSIEADGARNVLKLAGYTGGTGDAPTANIGRYVGATGYVTLIGDAVDVRGATGTTGDTGAPGAKGWAPLLSVASDGSRRVFQVVDWTGGEGTKPATGSYVGATGLVALITDAIDIRGPTGAAGSGAGTFTVPEEEEVEDGEIVVFDGIDPNTGRGSGVTVGSIQSDISDLSVEVAAIPNPIAMAIIFGGA